MKALTVVGGGLSGLIAAAAAAEAGWHVRLLEASKSLGGRARSLAGLYRANLGPHAVYVDGALWRWLVERDLNPEVVDSPPDATWICSGDRLSTGLPGLGEALRHLPSTAPGDLSFREWLLRYVDASTVETIVGLVFVTVYDHDPGRLSAEFMHERLRRTLAGTARYVVGGWSRLVDRLVERCRELDVHIYSNSRALSVVDDPTIVAVAMRDARKLTGDKRLEWPSAQTALLDLGLKADRGVQWIRVLDVDRRIYMARYTAVDPSLAPSGQDLIQMAMAHAPGESPDDPYLRADELLTLAWPGWRGRVQWQRQSLMRGLTGAIDLPGFCWRDRPCVQRNRRLYVATDQSAAPGMLAEVGAAAAIEAASSISQQSP